jgi:Bacteriophage probable baseplate hub protein
MVLSITYNDRLTAAASEVEIQLEDSEKRWQGQWYPTQGDRISLMIGYHGEELLPCGDFQVDELELDGPPDVFHLRCLSAFITPAMRTPNSVAYENQDFMQIAGTIAAKYGLKAVAAAYALNPTFARVTQKQESDLAFLKRIADGHNYNFAVRGGQLVFYSRTSLETAPPVCTIRRSNVERFRFKSRTHRIYRSARVSYQDPVGKQLFTQTADASPVMPTGDTLKLIERCENGQQATLKARAVLHRHNMLHSTGQLVLPGMTALVAGNNVTISGFGVNDGTYIIQDARHRLAHSTGYTTEVEVRRVP